MSGTKNKTKKPEYARLRLDMAYTARVFFIKRSNILDAEITMINKTTIQSFDSDVSGEVGATVSCEVCMLAAFCGFHFNI